MSLLSMIRLRPLVLTALIVLPLAGCNDALESVANKVEHPLPDRMVEKMKANDMSVRSPIMMRIFKEEGILEVWKQKGNGRFAMIAEYEICKWSGDLGPKFQEGDRQAPEGYYRIYPHQMNPKSSYYLSFNLGYPNRYDRSHGRTGSNLMVHGACSSAGCYSMTDEQVLEIYAFAREAFRGGQDYFQVAAYPFRMTPENMAEHRDSEHFEFWKMLKIGYDQFELTKRPPHVEVCERRYVFNQQPDDPSARFLAAESCPAMETPPSLALAYQAYTSEWNEAFSKAVAEDSKEDARRLEKEAREAEAETLRQARIEAAANSPAPLGNLFSLPGSDTGAGAAAVPMSQPVPTLPAVQPGQLAPASPPPAGAGLAAATAAAAAVPVPTINPNEAAMAVRAAEAPESNERPFWKFWGGK